MDPSETTPLAKSCYNRSALGGFIDGHILIDGELFSISPVEAAATEKSLQTLNNSEDILLEISFPTESIPVALGVALTYEQDPRRSGENSPVLMFPRQGYITAFDKIHYKHASQPASGTETEPIPRYPTGALSAIEERWGLWTANTRFQFDFEELDTTPGAIIVDLRAPRWNDTYAPQIDALLEEFSTVPTVFIAGEEDWTIGYELAEKHADEHVTIRPDHLESSPIDQVPVPQRTPLSTTESILATEEVTYHYYAVGDEELADLYPRFAAKKIELQERGIAPTAVGGLYNRLIQLPVKPQYWNEVTATHGYFDSVPQQIEHLSTVANQYETGGSRLQNFIETARQLEAHLNDQHTLQNYLLNAVDRAGDSDTPLRLVFSNEREKEAFLFAAEKNGYSLSTAQNVRLTTKGDLEPEHDVVTMFAGAPPKNSYHYEFPASETLVFMYFAILDEYVRDRGKSRSGSSVSHTKQALGTSDINLEPLDIDSIEAEVKDVVRPAETEYSATQAATDLLGGSSPWELDTEPSVSEDDSEDSQDDRSEATASDTTYDHVNVFEFEEDHEALELTPLSRVTLFHPEKGEIERTRAQNVEVGETMILMDGIADDLYELVLNNAREREQVREDENLVEGWRDQLNQVLESESWTLTEFHQQLVEMGSGVSDTSTISHWRYGSTLAPDDEEDIKRVYQLAQPGVDASMFENLASEVAAAAERLRRRHRKIGKRIRSLVEYELDASTTELPSYYDRQTQQRIREDTKRVTVSEINERKVEDEREVENEPASQGTPST